jgi:RNA polymerase primary sigma factor
MSRELEITVDEQAETRKLSREEEVQLAKLMESGRAARKKFARNPAISNSEKRILIPQIEAGFKARAQLIEANLPLVGSVARRYLGKGMGYKDLVQEGSLGLIRAVDKFDYKRGHRLSTLAVWWILDSITASFYRNREKDKDGRFPRSLDEPLNNDGGKEISLGERIPDKAPPVEETIEVDLQRQEIASVLEEILTPSEKEAIYTRFMGTTPFVRIAAEMGINRIAVQTLEKRAFNSVRSSPLAPLLRVYLD